MGLSARLLLLFALATGPALGAMVYNEFDVRRTRMAELREEVVGAAESASVWIAQYLRGAERSSALIASLPEVRRATSTPTISESCSRYLRDVSAAGPGQEIEILDREGRVVCDPRRTGKTAPQTDALQSTLVNNAFTVGEFEGAGADRYLPVFYPVSGEAGDVTGAVVIRLSLRLISDRLGSTLRLKNAVLSVHDRTFRFIVRVPDEAGLVGNLPPQPSRSLIRFANRGLNESVGADGLARIGVIKGLSFGTDNPSGTDLYLAVGLSRDAALADIDRTTQRRVFLLLLSASLAALAAWWGGTRFVQRPVEQLLTAASRWGDGDYRARVHLSKASPEFERLAFALEDMADHLEQRRSERDESERTLLQNQNRLRLAQEAGGLGLWDHDLITGYVHRAGSVFGSWGLQEGDTAGWGSLDRIVHPDDAGRARAARDLARAAAGVMESEYRITDRSGATRWLTSRAEIIRDAHGSPVRIVGVDRDVTAQHEATEALGRLAADLERKVGERTEQARVAMQRLFEAQKMESLGQLTGGVAHDFNNLLMAALGSLDLLRKRLPDDPKATRLLDNAVQAAERGATLTQRLLAFARRQDLRPEVVNVARVVEAMTDLLSRTLGPAIRIRTEFPPALPAVHVDAVQFDLAVLNLCINARDAMPDGGTVLISARMEDLGPVEDGLPTDSQFVRLSVSDTGHGMDEATAKRAAEPFFTTKGVGKGTGLGLSMVAGLAAQSGGRISIESRVGDGTTVAISLPVASGSVGEPSSVAADDPAQPATSKHLRVLVVDDDVLVAMGTAATLEDMGHAVTEAASGPRALEILQTDAAFDLILTDFAMPGMTGLELSQRIRARWPDIPVIMVTGYAELPEGSVLDLPRLSKPYRADQLATMLDQTLDRRANAGGPNRVVTAAPSAAGSAPLPQIG